MRIEEILLHLDLDDINQLFLICFSLKLFAGADAFSRQLIQLMNEKLIAPYSMITEKEKEIERLNREIGRLEALLEVSKKMNAQQEDVAKCADAV